MLGNTESALPAALRRGRALLDEFSAVGAETHASSIAYFTFLSFIPLITLCISLVSVAGINESQIAEFFAELVPSALGDFVKTLVKDAFQQSGIAFSISTLTLVLTASQGIGALRNGLNAAYGVKESRSAFAEFGVSIGAVIILGVLLAATMFLVFGGAVSRTIALVAPGYAPPEIALDAINSLGMAAIGVVTLAACYKHLPAGARRFSDQLPGAALASVACGLLTIGFRIYVDNFCNFDALYGSIATVALLLFWMFLIAFILIVGGFVNRAIAEAKSA